MGCTRQCGLGRLGRPFGRHRRVRGLCSLPGDQLALALSKGELRDKRPDEIPSLEAFDIDAEAEFLDWYDEQPVDWTPAGFFKIFHKSHLKKRQTVFDCCQVG